MDYAAIWRQLSILETWAERNLMTLRQLQYKVMGRNNPLGQYRLGPTRWKAALQKMSHPGGHGGHQDDHAPAMCSAVVRPHLVYCVLFWVTWYMDILERLWI